LNKKQRKYLVAILILGILGAIGLYVMVFKGNTQASNKEYFYIYSYDEYEDVRSNLIEARIIENVSSFDLVAEKMNLPKTYKAGRYKIPEGLSNVELVRKIRSGSWEKVVIKIKPDMSRDSVLTYLSDNLEVEKSELAVALRSDIIMDNGFTSENVWCIFLPDHYHFNWATPADKVLRRFLDEYNSFWDADRLKKAKTLNLSTKEVCILASIVDGEAIHVDEMPTIAGLYLNRIRKNMLLQADPTVLYVAGREGRRRVLYRDLRTEDPYNTYLNLGLPPGPIFLPDKRAIDASLNPKQHNYIFMCAKPDGSYYHNFTASKAQHDRNANAYRRSLNAQGIRR
jgi:UPF0755 protein